VLSFTADSCGFISGQLRNSRDRVGVGAGKILAEWDSLAPPFRRHRFGDAVSTMDVSAMKCEMYFPLECHQSANVRTDVVKRVGARFGLALVPIVQQ